MAFDLNAEMPAIVIQYAMYQRNIKGLSANTVKEYCMDLRTFFRFMKRFKGAVSLKDELQEIPVNDITIDFIKKIGTYDIFEFMNFVADEQNNISSTRQRKSSALKSFFQYLFVHEKLIAENPTETLTPPKSKKSLPHFLTLEQSVELLNAVEGSFKERDYCIIVIFLNCGLRLSELVGLNMSNIIHNNNSVRILGKGNKERMVYLNESCLKAIEDYLKVRPVDGVIDKNALFLSKRKRRISPKTVQHIVKTNLDKIGLTGPGYSVHKLRHTAATLMYQHGDVDIRVLQDILGHANLGTTEIYTHTSSKQIEEAANSNPLAKVQKRKK
jgi:Site-specific recombinase XerD